MTTTRHTALFNDHRWPGAQIVDLGTDPYATSGSRASIERFLGLRVPADDRVSLGQLLEGETLLIDAGDVPLRFSPDDRFLDGRKISGGLPKDLDFKRGVSIRLDLPDGTEGEFNITDMVVQTNSRAFTPTYEPSLLLQRALKAEHLETTQGTERIDYRGVDRERLVLLASRRGEATVGVFTNEPGAMLPVRSNLGKAMVFWTTDGLQHQVHANGTVASPGGGFYFFETSGTAVGEPLRIHGFPKDASGQPAVLAGFATDLMQMKLSTAVQLTAGAELPRSLRASATLDMQL